MNHDAATSSDEKLNAATLAQALLNDDKTAASWLDLDETNWAYYRQLYRRWATQEKKRPIKIVDSAAEGEESGHEKQDCILAYPTAIASNDQMAQIPVTSYEYLRQNQDPLFAQKVLLCLRKMQAGTGTSMGRQKYLAALHQVSEKQVRLGAKGTDLFIFCQKQNLSLAEVQILQAVVDAQQNIFGAIAWWDIIGPETRWAIKNVWQKKSYFNPQLSYKELLKIVPHLSWAGETLQQFIPCLDEKLEIDFSHQAPAGHGLFAFAALQAALEPQSLPSCPGLDLMISLGNGEDLGSGPDKYMVAWMNEHRIPIVMATTAKTNIDLKGGQIALFTDPPETYLGILEKAQAEQSGQSKLFEQLGLRPGDRTAYFNTNMAILNMAVLVPLLQQLVREIGRQAYLDIITPDVILNAKGTTEHPYYQLEGAMGSVLLNLDRFWRKYYGKPLVHLINIELPHRTAFFSPLKTAFDFFLQFYSDRFTFDEERFRPINQRPGKFPVVVLKDKFYKEVDNVLLAFAKTSTIDLDELTINGQVLLANFTLQGKIIIDNQSGKLVDLTKIDATILPRTLHDQKVVIDGSGKVQISNLI